MRQLAELFAAARAQGLSFDPRPGLPGYLSDAVQAAATGAVSDGSAPGQAKLVIAAKPVPLAQGDWLVADLPGGSEVLGVRALAAQTAAVGAQIHELVRLPGPRTVLVAHAAVRPQAAGPAFDLTRAARGWLEGAPTASDVELLTMANAAVLAREEASLAGAQLADRYLAEVAPLRGGLEEQSEAERRALRAAAEASERRAERLEADVARLKGELTERYRREDALRAELARIRRSPFYRAVRRIKRLAGR
ncbi:MAG: hypothetical protein LBC97_11005 [Bifidobacteriaceae bacterium]|jgi:hypothetical protein|nr:hypothetical protein [Bifidobacteriaceae bacterium]